MRIFLAIDLPDSVKNRIMELEKKLTLYSKFIRLSKSDNLHFTVKFLGEQNDFSVSSIKEKVKKTINDIEAFEININKSGIFGSLKYPKILWLGENNVNFINFSQTVNYALDVFRHEEKSPVCHLTIGRIKNMPVKDVITALNICKSFVDKNNLRFSVDSVYLYESKLLRSGAVYKKIGKFHMKERVYDG